MLTMAQASEALKRAIKKYDLANTMQIHLKLNLKTDSEIIDYLKGKTNVQGYIKELIRDDMTLIRSQNGSQTGS